ncbi:MAG TPA: glycosyltransferase family 39 protein [Rhizomicrobium sp.]|nr:glycosyltransferase family 39 protein [Rhizomicrobium sp.]
MSSRGTRRDFWAELAQPSTVVSFLVLYCAIHFLIRYLLSPNYTLDESEQMLFGQSLEWGYRFRHPPLITWLTWATLTATQNSRAAFFLLKYAIMAGGLAAYFAAARIVIGDVRMAALATFGLLTTFVMGWLPVVDLMHTVLLASMLAAFLWVGARILTRGTPRDYLLLAAITGLGILSKYVFLVLPVAYGIAVALTPRFRTRIKIGPLILSIVLAIAIVAPYAWWSYAHEYSLFALAETITKGQGPRFSPLTWLTGAGDLVWAFISFGLPLIVIFPILYWPACKKLTVSDETDGDWLRLYEITMAVGMVIMLGAVFFVGTEAFKARWMHQVAMPLPIYLFLRARIAGIQDRANKIFAGIALLFASGVAVARVAVYETHAKSCRECREYWPMKSYADAFERIGFSRGTILAQTYDLGGNLRAVFPDSRVVTPGYPVQVFGPPVPGPCLLVWEGDRGPSRDLTNYLARHYGVTADQSSVRGDVNALLLTSKTRRDTMNYILIQKGRCSGP